MSVVAVVQGIETGIAALRRLGGSAELVDYDTCRAAWSDGAPEWAARFDRPESACLVVARAEAGSARASRSAAHDAVEAALPDAVVLPRACGGRAAERLERALDRATRSTVRCAWDDVLPTVLRGRCAVSTDRPVGLRLSRADDQSVDVEVALWGDNVGALAAVEAALTRQTR